jgi:hypothetical protein
LIATAGSAAIGLLVWGLIHDGSDEPPWILAGSVAAVVLAAAVFVREMILKRARDRILTLERKLDRHLVDMRSRIGNGRGPAKLTIEQNEFLLREIKKKSDAAKVLDRFAAGHREVFELCNDYLARNSLELSRIGAGSPRLVSLRKGKERVSRYHRFHLLQWAELESRRRTLEAQDHVPGSEKAEAAESALNVIDEALGYYPTEDSLIESKKVLEEIIASIKVSELVEKAEDSVFRGDLVAARLFYRDALFCLGRYSLNNPSRDQAASKINAEIEKLRATQDLGPAETRTDT